MPSVTTKRRGEITQEEKERRERFKKMWAGLRAENVRLSVIQQQRRELKTNKCRLDALRITVLLNLMRLVRGLSLTTERITGKCPCCDHKHTVTVPIHSLERYNKSEYFKELAKRFEAQYVEKFGCGEWLVRSNLA